MEIEAILNHLLCLLDSWWSQGLGWCNSVDRPHLPRQLGVCLEGGTWQHWHWEAVRKEYQEVLCVPCTAAFPKTWSFVLKQPFLKLIPTSGMINHQHLYFVLKPICRETLGDPALSKTMWDPTPVGEILFIQWDNRVKNIHFQNMVASNFVFLVTLHSCWMILRSHIFIVAFCFCYIEGKQSVCH